VHFLSIHTLSQQNTRIKMQKKKKSSVLISSFYLCKIRNFSISVCCIIPLQPTLIHINKPKLLIDSKIYQVVILTALVWTQWLEDWNEGSGRAQEREG
jgi:hypothetical protein